MSTSASGIRPRIRIPIRSRLSDFSVGHARCLLITDASAKRPSVSANEATPIAASCFQAGPLRFTPGTWSAESYDCSRLDRRRRSRRVIARARGAGRAAGVPRGTCGTPRAGTRRIGAARAPRGRGRGRQDEPCSDVRRRRPRCPRALGCLRPTPDASAARAVPRHGADRGGARAAAARLRAADALLDELGLHTLMLAEDVHWADEVTLDALRYVDRRITRTRSVVVAGRPGPETATSAAMQAAIERPPI